MYGYGNRGGYWPEQGFDEESVREEELEEAERMVRNGASMRQIMRKQFSSLGQSDLYKLYRKYGMDPDEEPGSPGFF